LKDKYSWCQIGENTLSTDYLAIFTEDEKNKEWYQKNYKKLIQKYDGQYIAIYKQKIIDYDKNLDNLLKRIEKKYPKEHVLIEFVTSQRLELIL
jgi:hypothetical protein